MFSLVREISLLVLQLTMLLLILVWTAVLIAQGIRQAENLQMQNTHSSIRMRADVLSGFRDRIVLETGDYILGNGPGLFQSSYIQVRDGRFRENPWLIRMTIRKDGLTLRWIRGRGTIVTDRGRLNEEKPGPLDLEFRARFTVNGYTFTVGTKEGERRAA